MPQTPTFPAPRDWLLLIGGSTYKFTLTETFAKSPQNPLNSHPRHLGDFP